MFTYKVISFKILMEKYTQLELYQIMMQENQFKNQCKAKMMKSKSANQVSLDQKLLLNNPIIELKLLKYKLMMME